MPLPQRAGQSLPAPAAAPVAPLLEAAQRDVPVAWRGGAALSKPLTERAAEPARDPWPALPQDTPMPDQSWRHALREQERARRLDAEQRGDGWSVLPF
jgi:hypothetical protein